MCNRHLGKTAEKFALVSRLEATVSEYGKNLQDCKMEVLVGVRQQHSQLEFELSGQLHLFLNHMYALASIYGRWGCKRMCAITLHFSGLQLVFDAGALQPSLQLPGCLATGFRCVLATSMTYLVLIAWEGLCLSKHSEISSCSFHGLQSCSHPRFLLNPKEQFVKIQIVAVADGTDVALGEATVPIADPMSESMNSWCGASSCEELWWMLSGIETEATTKMQLLDRISKHLLADLEV